MKNKKVLFISLGVLVGIVGLFILLSFTAFSLRSIEIDYRTSHSNIVATNNEIIENSGITKGGSVFFKNKQKYSKQIEEKYPYVKVINIETVFPSKFVIHIAERQEIYAVKQNEYYYLCDNEFKVLKITDSFSPNQSNALLLEDVIIKEENYSLGDFLKVSNFVDIYESFYSNNWTLAEQQSMVEKIKLSSETDDITKTEILNATLTMYNGQEYIIKNCEYGLKYKTHLLIEVYSQIFDFIGKEEKTEDEESVTLTEENLKNAQIIINNFYDYTTHGEKDCYFDIVLKA